MLGANMACNVAAQTVGFAPSNPFYTAPPFDRIKNSDYQAAIDAGIHTRGRHLSETAYSPA
jgi:peptidyl-dipeptidase Dcp